MNLGAIYETGAAGTQDETESIYWYQKAAEQGNAAGQYNLAAWYMRNTNYEEATNWYRKAADQGYAAAQYNLGLAYANGDGVAQDYALAYKWTSLAAREGDVDAQQNMQTLRSWLSPSGLIKARRLIDEWEEGNR